jgi:hypothetical protein
MSWFDVLNGNYFLQVANSRDSIIAELQAKIDESNKDKSWFSFEAINYKKFVLVGDSVIVNRIPSTFSPYRGYGTIKIKFDSNDGGALINAQVIPYGKMRDFIIWFLLFFLILFSVFVCLTTSDSNRYGLIVPAWVGFSGSLFLAMRYYRYALKGHLKKILEDLNIKGELNPVIEHRSN